MGKSEKPYVRPGELGANELSYTVRTVTDGTRTIAEVYEGDAEHLKHWTPKPIGVGHSVRRKGERRDASIGVTFALARAFQDAADNARDAAERALNGYVDPYSKVQVAKP